MSKIKTIAVYSAGVGGLLLIVEAVRRLIAKAQAK